mgnify:CR=1 FL=1
MKSDILNPKDPRWSEFLETHAHDFHHLPAFVELEAKGSDGEAGALYIERDNGALLLPLIFRQVPAHLGLDARDAISPYGYPCPLIRGEQPETLSALIEQVPKALKEAGLISAFIRLHPLLANPLRTMAEVGEVIRHGPTVWIDMRESVEEMWRQTRGSDRNRMNKLRRQGYAARIDATWSKVDAFVALYNETMSYLDASAGYFYERAYFEALRDALDGRLHLCLVEDPEGEVVSAGVFSEIGPIVQFHLSGTRQDHRRTSPSRLMIDHMRRAMKERGCERFHLGGGVGAAEDSLFEFKRGFSQERAEFHSWRVIGDEAGYDAAEKAAKAAGACIEDGLFFPSYRRPIAS